jgi:hypothetical protein
MILCDLISHVLTRSMIALLPVALLTGNALAQEDGAQKPPSEMTIPEIMKEAHKAPTRLLKKVISKKDEASDADKQRLLELYKSMALQTPPEGDPEEWKERNELLTAAIESVVNGEEGGRDKLKKATNCMNCHKSHKGDS